MNFYKRFIGDIQRDTGHLSCAEMGVYDRLLDHYYATEKPLPNDIDSCCRIARAMTKDERKAVVFILSHYFKLGADGYYQNRAERELSEAQPKIEANRLNGAKGGRPKGSKKETQEKPNGFLEETQNEPNDNLSQSQSQNTHLSNSESNTTVPNVETEFSLTPVGKVCTALREISLPPFNSSNPKIKELVDAGATVSEFVDTALEVKAKDINKFNLDYLISVIAGRRKDVASIGKLHQGAMPPKNDREAGRNAAAKAVFKTEHIQHLMGGSQATEIEVKHG